MRIEDRLRETLPRVTSREEPADDMWEKVQRSLASRRRRVKFTRALGALGAVLFAAAIAWAALQPHSKPVDHFNRRPNHRLPVALSDLNWIGDRFDGEWKAVFTVKNRSNEPLGAIVSCYLEDANGASSEGGTVRIRYLRPGAERTAFVLIDRFRTTPATQHCHGRGIAPRQPQPRTWIAPHFEPLDVAFFDRSRGVATGRIEAEPCRGRCAGVLARSIDGGRHWEITNRGRGWADPSITVLGQSDAWASAYCGDSSCLLHSDDGGQTWARIVQRGTIHDPQFLTPSLGYAIGRSYATNPVVRTLILKTYDGGRTWPTAIRPGCPRKASEAVAVWFVSRAHGWVGCAGEPYSGVLQATAIVETTDGGSSWRLLAGELLPPGGFQPPSTLPVVGHLTKLQFLEDSQGWIWMAPPQLSLDGGHSWADVSGLIDDPDASYSGWFISDREGFAALWVSGVSEVLRTTDGGATWHAVWKREPADYERHGR